MQNKYPLWKYILIVVILVIGTLYALPNIYGDDPAVQISKNGAAVINQQVEKQVVTALQNADLKFKSIKQEKPNLILVRFNDVSTQLKAKEYLKASLGDSYTVAINLAPATPKWLRAIGANPCKLGLDLRGGVHFLKAIDINSVIDKRINGEVQSISNNLREKRIRYASVTKNAAGMVTIHFRDQDAFNKALNYLGKTYPNWLFNKVTNNGELAITGQMNPEMAQKMREDVIKQTMTVLRNRINELGVAEPIVQQQGKGRIAIDLPGVQDAAQAQRILGGTATLEFHMVDARHNLQAAVDGNVPIGSKLYYFKDGQPMLVKSLIVLKGSNITSASSAYGQAGTAVVNINVSGPDVSYFNQITRENVGKRMAIVYVETQNKTKLVKGKIVNTARKVEHVISAPRIDSALGNSFQITGMQSAQAARNLALLLRAGALPANIYTVAESTVGPSLGKANIHKGILSVEIGFIAIILFMALYYRLFGLVADLALGANLILIMAILSLLGATLTLPGIAGIVLSVGMAVDANVLINERIREELRLGMTPQAAIAAGYARAFTTIVDSNVTTLIVAVVLFALATGSVKGFAITLTIGLLTSMFTAITGTRAVINLVYGNKKKLKKLSIGV